MVLLNTIKTVLWLMILEYSSAYEHINLNITESGFHPGLGWDVTCHWKFPDGDTLQSVRLYNNGKQFVIFRPEVHRLSYNISVVVREYVIRVECQHRNTTGQCIIMIRPFLPAEKSLNLSCEVSGERPFFHMVERTYNFQPLVPPSDANVLMSIQTEIRNMTENLTSENQIPQAAPVRGTFNCTSIGLPAPNLTWTVDGQKQSADFTGGIWNETTKLWHVWSFLSVVASEKQITITCSPEVKGLKGQPASFVLEPISMINEGAALTMKGNNAVGCGFNALLISTLSTVFLKYLR